MSVPTALPKFIIFPDSSTLFTPKDTEIVRPSFAPLFLKLSSECDLLLVIPRIVVEEFLTRKLFECEQFLASAQSNLKKISKLTKIDLVETPTMDTLKEKLRARFDGWIANLKAVVTDVPVDEINWNHLIENAVGRREPFSPRTVSDPSIEKGFKDALILESLLIFHGNTLDRKIVFFSQDGLLSKTANERLGDQPRFRIEQSLDSFASYFALLLTEHNEEVTQAIISKVQSVFYTENDKTCVWERFGLLERVSAESKGRLKIVVGEPPGQLGPQTHPRQFTDGLTTDCGR